MFSTSLSCGTRCLLSATIHRVPAAFTGPTTFHALHTVVLYPTIFSCLVFDRYHMDMEMLPGDVNFIKHPYCAIT